MDKTKLFLTSCVSLVTTAMVFAIRGDVGDAISGAIIDVVGMRTLRVLSALGYCFGVGLIVFAPRPAGPVMSVFDDRGTTLLIMMHAWWPGGLMIVGLVAFAMTRALHAGWEIEMATILVPALTYLILALSLEYPTTERVPLGLSTRQMWREVARPLFVLLFGCAVAYKSTIDTLLVCSGLAGVGLYWLGGLQIGTASPLIAFMAATVFGIGKTFLWPTMLGVTAERFPRGAALKMMATLGAVPVAVFLALRIYFKSTGGDARVGVTAERGAA